MRWEWGSVGTKYRGVQEAREDGIRRDDETYKGHRKWVYREWKCFYCGRDARWRSAEGKPLCDFAAAAWRECYPNVPVRLTLEAKGV